MNHSLNFHMVKFYIKNINIRIIDMNHYNILHVSSDATLKEINKNFKELSNRYHPDKNPDDKYSEEKFKLISQAYTTLSDYEKRIQYDSEISKNGVIDIKITPFKMNESSGLIASFDQMFSESKEQLLLTDQKYSENKKPLQKQEHTFF